MRYENPEELASEMGTGVDFVSATIGLDDGVLSKNETKLCFFSQRMGGWEVIEEISISEINRIEVSESLLGSTTTVVTKSGRWI